MSVQAVAADTRAAIVCPLCAYAFDPEANAACPSCPLQPGCMLVCCPRCGHSTVDPAGSTLVAAGARAAGLLGRRTRLGRVLRRGNG